MSEDFSRDLRMTRMSRGETQREAADVVGVNVSTWSRWEMGISVPAVRYVPALAEYLGVTTEALVLRLVESD